MLVLTRKFWKEIPWDWFSLMLPHCDLGICIIGACGKEYELNYRSIWIHCKITPWSPRQFLTSSRLVFLLRMLCGSGLWVRLLTSSSELRRCGLRIGLSGLALRRPAPPTPSSRLRCFLRMPWRRKAKLLGSTTDGENVTGWDGTTTEPKRNRKFYLNTNNYLMI